MADVLVRDLDSAVVERLKVRARISNRSLQSEMKTILTRASEQAGELDRMEVASRIRESIQRQPQTDSAILLREDRDR